METNFGWSTPYSVGIEEEFQLVDAESLELVSAIEGILSAFEDEPVEPHIKPELLQSAVETSTKISVSVTEAIDDLVDLRARLRQATAAEGALIASAGTHPTSRYEHQEVTDRPRYAALSESLGWLGARQLVFGLHVHVGVGSAEKAIACANGLRSALPELLALSANSPFWQGRATGLASTRATILESLPRAGLPPAFSSFAEFEALVERGVRTGCFPDYTHIWWDVRLHPRLGTVEVRICDGQTRVESVAALAALIQSLVATLGSAFECGDVDPPDPHLLLEENRWRAARDGLDARLIDLEHDTERSAPEAIRALVERCAPAAEALGCAEELELVEEILARGNGADEQRQAYEETDSLLEVTRRLVEETAPRLARR
jgi:glutamate---cysteine ligase / carboxylate-amine ligase